MQQANVASRTSLFDLPDPSAQVNDPFATAQGPEPTSAPVVPPMPVSSDVQPLETISAPAAPAAKPQKRGLGGLFGRKKKNEQDSMSDWLGVEDDYDARSLVAVSARGITSRMTTTAGRAVPRLPMELPPRICSLPLLHGR